MQTSRSISLIASAMLIGLLATAQVEAASVGCSNATPASCRWLSGWGSNVPIRLTIGLDENNNLRWVASQLNNPSVVETGRISNRSLPWEFRGSSQADVMMEVPSGIEGVRHGPHTLRGGGVLPGIIFSSNEGMDIVIGGDNTTAIQRTTVPPPMQGLAILHPNRSGSGGISITNSWAIVGPTLAPSTSVSNFVLSTSATAGGSLCNLNTNPIWVMLGEGRKWGLTSEGNFLTDTSWFQGCVALYVGAMNHVRNLP